MRHENFRWCLRSGCDNGALYDADDTRIQCIECRFSMCYKHQTPWHTGFTCDEYDSQRKHGDPDYQKTQRWIQENTKSCPGCSVSILKDEGCFHMTCEYYLLITRLPCTTKLPTPSSLPLYAREYCALNGPRTTGSLLGYYLTNSNPSHRQVMSLPVLLGVPGRLETDRDG